MAINVTITGAGPLKTSLKKIKGKIKNPKSTLKKIGKKLSAYYQKNMKSEGKKLLKTKWKKLSPLTLASKARLGFGGKKILERTGKLRKGIKTTKLLKSEVTIGNKVKYYPYHQKGGRKLPQRQMLGINNEVKKIVMKEIMDSIKF